MAIISSQETETFTLSRWEDLYRLAQKHSPYYLIAKVDLGTPANRAPLFKTYDGVHFQRYLSHPMDKDPLTCLTILKTHYLVIPTFAKDSWKKNESLSFEEAQNQMIDVTELIKSLDETSLSIFFDSLNIFAAEKTTQLAEQVKKCQFILSQMQIYDVLNTHNNSSLAF